MRFSLLACLPLSLGLFCGAAAHADNSCYASQLQINESTPQALDQAPFLVRRLPSHNAQGSFLTRARMTVSSDNSDSGSHWDMSIQFNFPSGGVSLPYNVYAVAIEVPSEGYSYFYDFTESCTNPGVSIFPGGHIQLPVARLPRLPAGSVPQNLYIKVWGRL